MKERIPPCGNKECGVSTGICESITAGTGELSDYGYWEFPCLICPPIFEALLNKEPTTSKQLSLSTTCASRG